LFIANAYAWAASRGAPWALVTSARNCKRTGRVLDTLNRRAFGRSDAIIVNSEQVQHYIEREYRAPSARIAVVYNAIDLQRFQPRAEAGLASAGPRVAMVGRLVAQKNPQLFVAAAAQLRVQRPDVRFLLVGDGPLRGQLERSVTDAGLADCITFAGERSDVEVLLHSADLFWLTSDWEGLPNAVIEAFACGLPVVATDVGGTAELLRDGVEGYLIAPGDCDALVAKSVAILGDPERQGRMRAAARQRAESFGRPAMVRATQAVYERALAGRGQG
ncbi:MAG: glycosyltransferase, partial [Candidatus Binatia bacterium]